MSEQMRAAWSRRTDEELLHAFFLEELSSSGRTVVRQLVVEKVGSIDTYVSSFEREQGELVAAIPVRGCEVDDAPAMWGHLVLTTKGIGFVPQGAEQSLAHELASDFASYSLDLFSGKILETLLEPAPAPAPRALPAALAVPLPLLAAIQPSAAWIRHDQIQQILCSPDFLEVIREGERVLCASPAVDADVVVTSWAEAHDIDLVAIDPAPFMR
ncbi:MAG: hypothetical protein ACKV2T_09840 [Kofleriaceae bacterium]